MKTNTAHQNEDSYLVFSDLANYLPQWEICSEKDWGGGSNMLIRHNHIKNGAKVHTAITTLEDFCFRIPFHRECHALLQLQHPGVLNAHRIVKVNRHPILFQEGYEVLPNVGELDDATRIHWLSSLAETFDTLFTANFSVRRVSLADVVLSEEKRPVLIKLGWLATYFPTEEWRETLEDFWEGTEERTDLISFLGIMAEMFSLPLPKEGSLHECLSFMLEKTIEEEICSAQDIVTLLVEQYKPVEKSEVIHKQSQDWSIDPLWVYHEQISMVCAPQGEYMDDDCAIVLPTQTWISQHPISKALFALVLNKASIFEDGPVEDIAWWEAIRFCNALSRLFRKKEVYRHLDSSCVVIDETADGFRLPYSMELLCAFHTSREYLIQESSYEWMQDRQGTREKLGESFVFDASLVEETPLHKNKRLVCSSIHTLESRLPSEHSLGCGFRVVLNRPKT